MRGRKPLPPELKVISGTFRPDREPVGQAKFEAVKSFPAAPQHLNPDGVEIWNDIGTKLVAAGALRVIDLYALEHLAYCFQQFRQKAKANLPISASDNNTLKSLFSEFGMTPASYRRVPLAGGGASAQTSSTPHQGQHAIAASEFANNGQRPQRRRTPPN